MIGIGRVLEHSPQTGVCLSGQLTGSGAGLQQHAGPAGMPGTGAPLERDQLVIGKLSQVGVATGPVLRRRVLGGNPKDAAGVFVQHLGTANVSIVPIEHVDRPLRSDLHTEADPLGVVGQQEILAVPADKSRPLGFQHIGEHGVFMDVGHKQLVAIALGKGVGKIDPRTTMGRTMAMVRNRLDITIDVRIEMAATLPLIDATGDDVPEMWNHAGRDEQLALGVVIDSPGITETVRDHFKAVLGGMVAPDAAVDVDRRSAKLNVTGERILVPVEAAFPQRLADLGRSSKALATVEPAIGAPVETVDRLVPIANAPARQANLDGIGVHLVVSIPIGQEEQIGGGTQPDTTHPNGQRRGKRDPLGEHRAAVGGPIPVGILQDHDSTVSGVGETTASALIVPVLGDPHPSAVIPAERHRLGHHRLGRPDVGGELGLDGHRLDRLLRLEELGRSALLPGQTPQRPGTPLAAETSPFIGQRQVVQLARVDAQLVADGHLFAPGDLPVSQPGPHRAHAELTIHPPRLGKTGVLGVVKDGDVRQVVATFDLHPHIDPGCPLPFGPLVPLAGSVDHGATDSRPPGHPQEQPAVIVLTNGDVDFGFARPLQVEHVLSILLTDRPDLRLGQHHLTRCIEQVVDRLPLGRSGRGPPLALQHRDRHPAPIVTAGMMKIITPIDARETPVQARLMRVVGGAGFGQHTAAVGRHDRMEIRAKSGFGMLSEHQLLAARAVHSQGACLWIVLDPQVGQRGTDTRPQRERHQKQDVGQIGTHTRIPSSSV